MNGNMQPCGKRQRCNLRIITIGIIQGTTAYGKFESGIIRAI
jgi:hypothetical protein